MLAHPRPADLARHAVGVARLRKLEDEDEMGLVDLRDASGERARIDREPHPVVQRVEGRLGDRLAKTEVIDDDVHGADPTVTRPAAARGAFPYIGACNASCARIC